MIKMPNFLRDLIESDAYFNKQHQDHQDTNEKVNHYMKIFYPGEMHQDATGKFVPPEYDMTLDQFNATQKQIDAVFEVAKEDAENDVMDQYGKYFENIGINFDIDAYVVPGESIPVKVLYSAENITVRNLETYDLDIPDFEKINKMWVWHGESSENTCDDCASWDGQLYFNEDEVPECPVHPNCRCWVEEIESDEDGNVLNRRRHSGAPLPPLTEEVLQADKDNSDNNTSEETESNSENNEEVRGNSMMPDEKFERLIQRVQNSEGGYENRPDRIDQETNMGIIQDTLDSYNASHPDAGFPSNLRELTWEQAAQIYREEYFDNNRIAEINDLRVAYAVMDMGVMTSPRNVGNIVQSTINEVLGQGRVTHDGQIGTQTINALNDIPESRRDEFIGALIQNRMNFLRGLDEWRRSSGGWTTRTHGYIRDFD